MQSSRMGTVQDRPHWPKISGLWDLRVLLADDSRIVRVQTANLLGRLGIKPKIVANGEEALQIVFEQEVDIILMDIDMPVMDGIVATNRLREFEGTNPSRRRTPVVAYTASLPSHIEAALLRIGIDAVLEKPCGVLAMSECIQRLCADKLGLPRDQRAGGGLANFG
jgi:CheY-like chemotaxis protein